MQSYRGVVVGVDVGLVVVEQFLNTLDERTFNRHGAAHVAADDLLTGEAWSAWLEAHTLTMGNGTQTHPEPSKADRGVDLETVRALRAGLRAVLLGDRSAAEVMTQFPIHLVPNVTGVRLAASTGSTGLDAIVEAVAVAVATGRWVRLKLCASDDCRWAFYDTSRSGGGRWCSMEVCGNRHKTRAYRRRAAAS